MKSSVSTQILKMIKEKTDVEWAESVLYELQTNIELILSNKDSKVQAKLSEIGKFKYLCKGITIHPYIGGYTEFYKEIKSNKRLTNPELMKTISKRFDYMLIDKFQAKEILCS